MKKNIIFVCVENSNRSQMAEAFAMIHGEGMINAFSAGSKPSGKINPRAIESMKMIGYDLSTHHSKSIAEFQKMPFDYVITMGCNDECPYILTKYREDWDIPDPRIFDAKAFNYVRDLIEIKVKILLEKISLYHE